MGASPCHHQSRGCGQPGQGLQRARGCPVLARRCSRGGGWCPPHRARPAGSRASCSTSTWDPISHRGSRPRHSREGQLARVRRAGAYAAQRLFVLGPACGQLPVARALGFLMTCAGHSWAPPPEEYQHPPIHPPSPCQRCAAQGGRLTCWPHRGAGGGGAHAALGCSPPRTCGGLTTTPPQSNRLTCREPPCPAVSPGPTTPPNVQPDLGPSTSCLRSRPPAVALTGPPSAPRGLRTRPGSGAGRRGWPCLGDASVTQGAPRLGQKGRLLPLPQRTVRSKVTEHPVVTPSVEWGCWRDPPSRAVGRRHEKSCRKDLEDRWSWVGGEGPQHGRGHVEKGSAQTAPPNRRPGRRQPLSPSLPNLLPRAAALGPASGPLPCPLPWLCLRAWPSVESTGRPPGAGKTTEKHRRLAGGTPAPSPAPHPTHGAARRAREMGRARVSPRLDGPASSP